MKIMKSMNYKNAINKNDEIMKSKPFIYLLLLEFYCCIHLWQNILGRLFSEAKIILQSQNSFRYHLKDNKIKIFNLFFL